MHVLFSLEDGSLRNYQPGVVQLLHFHSVCVSTGKWWFQLGFSARLFLQHISASAASGSVPPAADEKHNLPLSVFSIVSVPLFNWKLTILGFDTFILVAHSNTIYIDAECRETTQNIKHRKSISPGAWQEWVFLLCGGTDWSSTCWNFSGPDLGSFLVDLCNYCFATSEQNWNSQAVWAKSKQQNRFLLVGISSAGFLYSQEWCISLSVML